ncbi:MULTISPECIES: WXG100 family type VII secretion target [unclassified Nocardioides]|uniref:WXG100 family type VII secretion target n=1 Tax=unclassified Nocardioides TaxID=2615069 RepID=UPI000ACF8807|nr:MULTISPECIES: WXG100 family type VII secretion target [unclassified Nocardioides]
MAFQDLVTELGAIAARLHADRDRASRQVETLLDGGWSGAAATAYDEGWADWQAGADRVLDGLEAMTDLLRGVERSFVTTDRDGAAAVGRLTARLG